MKIPSSGFQCCKLFGVFAAIIMHFIRCPTLMNLMIESFCLAADDLCPSLLFYNMTQTVAASFFFYHLPFDYAIFNI